MAHFFVLEESSIFGKARGPQIRAKKKNEVGKDQENEFRKIFIIYLGSNKGGKFQFKQTFEFSRSYSEIQPSKLTNHSARTN